MRSEILTRVQTLLTNEDLEAIRKDVRNAIDEFRVLTQEEIRHQREAFAESEHEPDAGFEYVPDPVEAEFDAAINVFKEREKAWRSRVAEEQRVNLDQKLAMLERLRHTIQEEENIGAAFAVFNEVREQWSKVGDVPGDRHKEVQDTYNRLRDEFFYNITIYKELKEHDLRVNLKRKEELIELAKGLAGIDTLIDREKAARSLQKQWFDIGPSPRESYQEIADAFFGQVRPVFEEVKSHYDEIRASFKDNAAKKEALIEELRAFVATEVDPTHEGWQQGTAAVVALQTRWKEAGFAGKEVNEQLWTTFRELTDVFFAKKQLHYDAIKAVGKENRDRKAALIEKAEALSNSTEWRTATDAMIALQKEWKDVGPANPADEQRLWRQFRKAQDTFFKAKKAQFADRDATEQANLNEKEALLEAIQAYELTGDRKADLDALKEFGTRWNAIGFVPRKALDGLMERFRTAMDAKYATLSAQRSERSIDSYRGRVERLAEGDTRGVAREQSLLREKIDRLRARVTATEENLMRFTGKGAEAIREQYEKSIREDKREMEEIREKLKLLSAASKA
jgi:hypothetical protein